MQNIGDNLHSYFENLNVHIQVPVFIQKMMAKHGMQ